MPLDYYGVLKGRVLKGKEGRGESSHYQVHVIAQKMHYRIAINIKSKAYPSEVLFYVDENFHHEFTSKLSRLPLGFTPINKNNKHYALDYLRRDLFDLDKMTILPHDKPGPNNDLNEKVGRYISKAIKDEEVLIYAFGEKWGPESRKDTYFHFNPSNGMHDIHMNQGSSGKFSKDNGIWQDGGLFLFFPNENRWVAIFLAFQSQFHKTDNQGNPINLNE